MKYQVFVLFLLCFSMAHAMQKSGGQQVAVFNRNSMLVSLELIQYYQQLKNAPSYNPANEQMIAINIKIVQNSSMTDNQREKALGLIKKERKMLGV